MAGPATYAGSSDPWEKQSNKMHILEKLIKIASTCLHCPEMRAQAISWTVPCHAPRQSLSARFQTDALC